MSNHLAIATVSAALRRVLNKATTAVPGSNVTTKRPEAGAGVQQPAINVYLYQVSPNAAYRNEDLPTRRSGGDLVQRPRTAVVLHYLVSFLGDDEKLEPQRLMGAALRELHAHPQLLAKDYTDVLANPPYDTLLAGSNIARQVDRIRFTPLNLSLDELSKVWSVFFQTPYVLSFAYQASAVLIETDDTPVSPLPVRSVNIDVFPFRHPTITRIVADGDPEIFSTSTLLIQGTSLLGETTLVLLGGVERVPSAVTDNEVRIAVPANTSAGAHGLQVIHKRQQELKPLVPPVPPQAAPHALRPGFESNVGTFVLTPRITNVAKITVAAKPALKVDVDVTVGKEQRVVLLLESAAAGDARAHSFIQVTRPADGNSVTIPIPGTAPGEYFVRLQIEGAASPLDVDPASPTFGPTVTLP